MDNIIFGLEALFRLLKIEIIVLFYSPIVRGFVAGYLVSTLVYGFIVAGKERRSISENKNNI